MHYIKEKWNSNDGKVNLIVGDGGIGTGNNLLLLQKLDLAQVITVIACSSKGGSCCIKHFSPYIKFDRSSVNASGFFISFLYLYYITFEEVNLFKPYTSNPDSGEFYVIGKKFKGIETEQLDRLFNILDNFKVNDAIIEEDKIPESFLLQVNSFLEKLSNLNNLANEKQNLLLTCYKETKHNKHPLNYDKNLNKILNCESFLNSDELKKIQEPRYKEWIRKYKFDI